MSKQNFLTNFILQNIISFKTIVYLTKGNKSNKMDKIDIQYIDLMCKDFPNSYPKPPKTSSFYDKDNEEIICPSESDINYPTYIPDL